jgi:hypothetical protein
MKPAGRRIAWRRPLAAKRSSINLLFRKTRGASNASAPIVEVNTTCPTFSSLAASIRFRLPFRSVHSGSNPVEVCNELAVVTTASHPWHALRNDSAFRKSPTTSSAPEPRNTTTSEAGRTNARTTTPSMRSRRTMARPSLPVDPTTKTTLVPLSPIALSRTLSVCAVTISCLRA